MGRVFIIRLSSLGDVAILVPLLSSLTYTYPETHFVVLSKPSLVSLFEMLPSNISFKAIQTSGSHKGLPGLYKLFSELNIDSTDILCDIHDNIRSHFLGFLFSLRGASVFCIDKGRKARRKLVRKHNKVFKPLICSFERYKVVLEKAGFPMNKEGKIKSCFTFYENMKDVVSIWGIKNNLWIGIAPFAKHFEKIYPVEMMKEVVERFAQDKKFTVFLFGGGSKELSILETWKRTYPSLKIPYGTGFGNEIKLISCLDIMLTMDSANLHLASMVGTPVVSVWGATHPYAGFYGLGQKATNAIQTELYCRPCSVFGEKKCYRGDNACMNGITPEQIIKKIETELNLCSNG